MGDLERVGRSFSLLVWILVLAALGILFGSCTSSYSPSTLYFFKVTDILLIYICKARIHANLVEVHLQPSNPNDSLQHEESYANLPTFYAVGLLGFCQGQKDITRFSNCSNPSLLFSFDPLETLRSMSNQTQSIQEPGAVELYLDQHRFARYSIWAYLIGLVATFFAATFGLFRPRLSRTKLFHIISAIVSFLQPHEPPNAE
jgi:hypothetical protein